MNRLFFAALLAVFMSSALLANNEIRSKANIERVTLYRQGAKITCTGKVNLPDGKSYIVLEQLCQGIQPNSIQVKIPNSKITFLSATPRVNYLQETENVVRYQRVQDTLDALQRDLDKLNIKINALTARRNVLMNNNPLEYKDKETTFTIEQMRQFMDFRQRELLQMDNENLEFSYQKQRIEKERGRLQAQLNTLSGVRQRPTGEVVIQLQSTGASVVDLECSFLVNDAGWMPLYDIRTEGLDKPVKLAYKAQVFQVSGIDWKRVKMTLSTANPKQNHDRPILTPLYVDFAAPIAYNYYDNQQYASPAAPNMEYEKRAEATTNMAYAHDMARSAQGNSPLTNTPQITQTGNDGVVEFEIDVLQDLESDRNRSIVPIKEYDIPANYEYHSVPKIDNGAFLLARLTDYGQYNLLPGQANIFQEGMYLGQATINPQVASDTLYLSLGRDEKLVVKREKIKDLTSVKTLGSTQKEAYGFEISIRNNKNKEITLDLLDQIPISKNKDIEVKLLEAENAEFVEAIGSLRWKIKVPAGQTAKIKFSYHIKYPKGKNVALTKS